MLRTLSVGSVALFLCFIPSLAASAQEIPHGQDQTPPVLADPVVDAPTAFQRDPVLGGIHFALGWATVATGVATGIFDPQRAGLQTHETLAWTSAGLAAVTMAFGLVAHYGEIGPDSGWSPNNVHALLGAAGGTLMMVAPFVAPQPVHRVVGELGALTMGLGMAWKILF